MSLDTLPGRAGSARIALPCPATEPNCASTMTPNTNKRPSTATEAYLAQQALVQRLLPRIHGLLEEHEGRQIQDQGSWAYAGDLGHVREQLEEVVRFLGHEPG